jgi:hypothetical protein
MWKIRGSDSDEENFIRGLWNLNVPRRAFHGFRGFGDWPGGVDYLRVHQAISNVKEEAEFLYTRAILIRNKCWC